MLFWVLVIIIPLEAYLYVSLRQQDSQPISHSLAVRQKQLKHSRFSDLLTCAWWFDACQVSLSDFLDFRFIFLFSFFFLIFKCFNYIAFCVCFWFLFMVLFFFCFMPFPTFLSNVKKEKILLIIIFLTFFIMFLWVFVFLTFSWLCSIMFSVSGGVSHKGLVWSTVIC